MSGGAGIGATWSRGPARGDATRKGRRASDIMAMALALTVTEEAS